MSKATKALKSYFPGEAIIEINDPFVALKYVDSKMSMCWGNGPITDTDYFMLAHPSKISKDDVRTVLVCSNDVIAKLSVKHPFYDTDFRSAVKLVYDPTALTHDNLAEQPESLEDLIEALTQTRKRAAFNWITGRVAYEVLAVADGAEPTKTFTA